MCIFAIVFINVKKIIMRDRLIRFKDQVEQRTKQTNLDVVIENIPIYVGGGSSLFFISKLISWLGLFGG